MPSKIVKFADTSLSGTDIHNLLSSILSSGQFINGNWNAKFIEHFSVECEGCHVAPVASGSAALTATLCAMFPKILRDGSYKVIVPDLSFAATLFSVLEANFKPVFCDVDDTGLIDWDICHSLLEDKKVLAVLPVHLYGQKTTIPLDILEQVMVIEDACQAHGIVTKPQGQAACFSFYPSKNLGAAGDAGAVISDNVGLIRNIRRYCNYGDLPGEEKYVHRLHGSNMRMDELQAAVLVHKLQQDSLEEIVIGRVRQAELYAENGVDSFVSKSNNAYHLYPVLMENQAVGAEVMKAAGIETGIHYPYTLEQVYLYDRLHKDKNSKANYLVQHVFSLPIGKHLADDAIIYVCDVLKSKFELVAGLWKLK